MTTYYVGVGGSNANSGLTWALRKLTLNGVEDVPVAAGDVVYVGAGTYRELLTVDVSGTAGNPITYIGDYLGTNTDGVGGVVRITGSDNDQTATRTNCIFGTNDTHRTFQGFCIDMSASQLVLLNSACTDWTIQQCAFSFASSVCIHIASATQARITIRGCLFIGRVSSGSILITHTSVVDNVADVIENCVFIGPATSDGITITRVGGITIRNSVFLAMTRCVRVSAALTVGQTVTVNNCILQNSSIGLTATVLGEIVEDYNAFYGNTTDRTNVAVGANSNAFPALFDTRWFFQLLYGGAGPYAMKQVISPFDLASYSPLVNLAGTSPPAADLRGTTIQGAQREWGPLEYDPTLKQFGGIHKGRIQAGS